MRENVDSAIFIFRAGEQLRDAGLIGNVDVERTYSIAQNRAHAIEIQIGSDDMCALFRKPQRGCTANPARRTRDDRDFPLETVHSVTGSYTLGGPNT